MSTSLDRFYLRAIVIASGTAVMAIEMAAARLLAPYFGTSLYVWAVLIGLIMIYLSVGYFVGGRLADRFPKFDVLLRLVAAAGFCVGLIPPLAQPVLTWSVVAFEQLSIGVFLGSLLGVIALFALPVLALGCVSPFAIRLAISDVRGSGNVSGSLYALSTIGSLVGTFGAVFVLIPTIGTRHTLLGMSLLLLVASLAGLVRRRPLYAALLVPPLLQLALPGGSVRGAEGGRLIYERESAYYYIQVVRKGSENDLVLDEGHAVHSVYDPHRLLTGQYWDDFLLAPLFEQSFANDSIRNVAVLGLGGGTAARLYRAAFPHARIDAAEIDPAVVSVARRYFGLNSTRTQVYTEDARYFLLSHPRQFDVVTVDAFRQPYIPFQLTTHEFFSLVRSRLSDNGAVAVNCGHSQTDYRLVNEIARTMRAVFPAVFIADVPNSINSVVIATSRPANIRTFERNLRRGKGPIREVGHRALAHGHLRQFRGSGPIFTDDLAPVEQLIDQMVLDYARTGT